MPQQRMDIRMIKDILRLKYQGGLSHDRIARSLSISKGVVAKYLGLAGAAGLDWAATAELDEASLERRLLGRSAVEDRLVEADFAHVHIELRRKGVTLVLLWQEYRAANEGRRTWAYTQFCEHYKAFAKSLKRARCASTGAPARSCSSTTPARRWRWPTARARRCSWPPWARRATRSRAPPSTRACARGWARWRAR